LTGEGIPEMWGVVAELFNTVRGNGVFEKRRKEQVLKWVNDMAREHLENLIGTNRAIAAARARIEAEVTAGKVSPTQAAQEIIDVMERELFHAGR
ncbi:MAG: methylmalonyl Co-A mutase-associated GTPase MeaB, partial [Pyramidobacter sp.]|nr:methylmalonyl Co-A mutase-associated GTPase MeaB [Pyramidobacter sp.]